MNIDPGNNWENLTFRPADFLEFMRKKAVVDRLTSKTVRDAVGEFVMDCHIEGKSAQTLRFYQSFLRPFQEMVGADTEISSITPATIRGYFAAREDGHIFAAHSRYRALRAFLNWCTRQGYLAASPLALKAPKLPQRVKPNLSPSAIKDLLEKGCVGPNGIRDRAMVLTLYSTGIREGELQKMQLKDLDLRGRLIRVMGKGNVERIQLLSEQAAKAIWRYLRERPHNSDHVWLTEEGTPLKVDGIYRIIKRLAARAGISERCYPHLFRHTFAGYMAEQGIQLDELQYLLGHKGIEMSAHYARETRARRALRQQAKHCLGDNLGLK